MREEHAMATTVTIRHANATAKNYEDILTRAKQVLEQVMKHADFAPRVKGANYSGGRQFKESNGNVVTKSADEVLNIILKGIERDTDADEDLDMIIRPYPHKKGVVGSARLGGQPIKPAIWFLERCQNNRDAISLARHLIHEWLHVAGFFHGRSGPDQDDVPHQVGDIVRSIAKSMKGQKLLDAEFDEYLNEDSLTAHLLEDGEELIEYDESEW
jgi:hypothetical protein